MAERSAPTLTIDFVGEHRRLEPGESMTFGRAGDLVIDEDNQHLHRVAGEIACVGGRWVLRNVGSTIPLQVVDLDSASGMHLAPRREVSLTFERMAIRFQAGSSNYEIYLTLNDEDLTWSRRDLIDLTEDRTTDTILTADLPLSDKQRLLLVALAQDKLAEPYGPTRVRSNKAIRVQLGLTDRQFNGQLDAICAKYSREGVRGLQGRQGELATDRRVTLVEFAVNERIVVPSELELLPNAEEGDLSPST